MTAKLIDGKAVAASIRAGIKTRIDQRLAAGQRQPGLTVILVGDHHASEVYVRNKHKACVEVGIRSEIITRAATLTEAELLAEIDRLNADDLVDGILVQLPLPAHLNSDKVLERLRPDKDVDGFHPHNMGRLVQKRPLRRPCTPYGVMKLIETTGVATRGTRAVVVGASIIVGRPMALELLLADATVTICNSKTRDLAGLVAQADIVVAAIGKPEFVQGGWIKPGAVVIDVGINRLADGRLVGDVEFAAAKERAGWITPVPGGVGPMTIAMLLQATLQACEQRS